MGPIVLWVAKKQQNSAKNFCTTSVLSHPNLKVLVNVLKSFDLICIPFGIIVAAKNSFVILKGCEKI
jgi:uncharacterized Tic20 family protein